METAKSGLKGKITGEATFDPIAYPVVLDGSKLGSGKVFDFPIHILRKPD
jgi:hypothetical protein